MIKWTSETQGGTMHPAARLGRPVVLAALIYACISIILTAFFSKPILDGESGSLLSVSLNIAAKNQLYHELFGDLLQGVELNTYSLHPPLYYALEGLLLKLVDRDIVGFLALNLLAVLAGSTVTAALLARYYGYIAAAIFVALAATFAPLLEALTVVRPEAFSGFLNGLVCLTTLAVVLGEGRRRFVWVGLASLFSCAAIATHWYNLPIAAVAAILVVARILSDRRRIWLELASGTGVALAGMLAWNHVYGGQLLGHLRLVSSWGQAMAVNINLGFWSHFVKPALSDLGGIGAMVGALVIPAFLIIGAAKSLRGSETYSPKALLMALLAWHRTLPLASLRHDDRISLVLIAFSAGFLAFMAVFVGGLLIRYWGNIFFILAALSALGFGRLILTIAEGWANRRKSPQGPGSIGFGLTTMLAVILCFGSASARTYFTPSLFALHSTSPSFGTVRSVLDRLVPGDATVLLGSGGYPYLYDRALVSTYTVVLERYITQTPDLPPDQAFDRFAREYGDYWTGSRPYARFSHSSFADDAVQRAQVIVTTDQCHWWQCIFYQPGVWRQDFRKVASIILVDPYVNGRPKPSIGSVPRLFSVYFRNDVADEFAARAGIDPQPDTVFENGVAVFTTGRTDNRGSEIGSNAWTGLTDEAKRQTIIRYLDDQKWFGLSRAPAQNRSLVAALLPEVDQRLGVQQTFERSLDQAIDQAFTQRQVWCGTRLGEDICGKQIANGRP